MADVESLRKQRSNIKRSFERLEKFVKALKPGEIIIDELQVKLQRTEDMFQEVLEIENGIYSIDRTDEPQLEIFEEQYYYIAAQLKRAIREAKMSIDPNMSTAVNDSCYNSRDSHADVKLPKINIKPFNGEYTEWQTFYEMFVSSIHNSTLQPIQKFQYLMSLLKEKPARLLKHIPITEANYLLVLNKLKARYDRKKYTVEHFIQTFMNQPSITQVNSESIHQLHDVSDEVLRGLKGLGEDAESRDPWLLHILISKIDAESRNLWAQKIVDNDYPTINNFFEFLQARADALETFSSERPVNPANKTRKTNTFVTSFTCSICHTNQHQLYQCGKFQNMSVEIRRELMKNERRCFNCLADNHLVYQCKSKKSCRFCRGRHNSLLNIDNQTFNHSQKQVNTNLTTDERAPQVSNNSETVQPKSSVTLVNQKKEETEPVTSKSKNVTGKTCMQQSLQPTSTLLPTALVNVCDSVGQWQPCRALLDSGSESSFISEQCINRLGLKREHARLEIFGLNQLKAGYTKGITSVVIKPHFNSGFQLLVKAYVTPAITHVITPVEANICFMQQLKGKHLADPSQSSNKRIDLLIGIEHFFSLMLNEQIKTKNSSVIAQKTKLGWIVAGHYLPENEKGISSLCTELSEVNQSLQKFWAAESLPSVVNAELEPNEEYCEKLFCQTTTRNQDGHYTVKLPFTDTAKSLGESYATAKTRLLSMERKFNRDNNFHQLYREFMSEYETLGHMTKINTNKTEFSVFLPHHGVYKESSSTTRLRVVFDASSKTSTGKSLNNILAVGPTIQRSLYFILLQFRCHSVVFVADIEKMYRQVWVDPDDRKFQRILWREHPNQPISVFELNTITYGMSPSSYLATRVLKLIADENESNYPEAANIIRNNIYMDDLMSGANSVKKAIRLKREISQLFENAGLKLRKWLSNSGKVLDNSKPEDQGVQQKEFDRHSDTAKVLGLLWSPSEDALTYSVHLDPQPSTTKRKLLSESSRLFDPLGLLSPFTIRIKIVYQSLWPLNLGWDDKIPLTTLNEWLIIRNEIPQLTTIKVPRWMQISSKSNMSLHGFCDASENAYAAAVYICDDTNQTSSLLTAKTKVAPLENISIARLELNGALILTRLIKYVREIYRIEDQQVFAWTDSKVVLDWLSHIPKKWKVFVANRTSEIRESLPRDRWHYVPTTQNPADCATRGLTPTQLKDHSLWWNGPKFIVQEKSYWPIMGNVDPMNQLEVRKTTNMNLRTAESHSIIYQIYERNANYSRCLLILTYIYRWYLNCKQTIKKTGSLQREEINSTSNHVYREIQNQHFIDEIKAMQKSKQIFSSSKLKALDPFLDDNNVLRVGGRIQRAPLPFNQKHPVILPGDDTIVKGIITYYHVKYLHCGPSYLYTILKKEFWILKVRSMIREIINNCVNCTKQKRKWLNQKMGMLPKERVELVKPFTKVGIDFAGPIKTYSLRGRGQKSHKSYICVFVCMCTKAIHVEIVTNLSTDAFLAAFKRFTARRGMCTDVFTDNGTNFHGAQRKLADFNQMLKDNSNLIATRLLREHEVNWHFIPPYSPHFGGLWEACIKSIKTQLERVIGNQILTTEELETLLIQVEGMLNQRPLYRASPEDDDVLTPAHYLVGQQLIPFVQTDITEGYNRLNHWQIVQKMVQLLWKRWYKEYVNTLQQRTKWKFKSKNLMIGDIVIVKEDNPLLNQWKMGKITKIHPGEDELVRKVTIKTIDGEIDRAVTKLCALPIPNQ